MGLENLIAQTCSHDDESLVFNGNTTKQALGFQNPIYLQKAQQSKPKLYVGDIIVQTNPIVIPDSEETLALAEESRSKMILKHKDNMMLEKKKQVDTTPIDYAALNQLYKDFPTRFVPQTELSAEQAFWSQNSVNSLTELQTDFVKRETYDKLFKSFTILEKHCISLEVDTQLKQEIFQRENSVSNQSVPSFDQLFELNELKAQSQEKDTVIKKLKERIKSLSGKMDKDKIKQDFEEIETINIELDHRVTKLIAENEHLKQTYKKLYDSIKPARIRSKEQCDDLINQVNIKSAEIFDLNASLQEKALAITTLKDELRKLKGKALVDNNVSNHPSDPELHQHSKLNANSELKGVKCKGCMLSDNHDLCVLDFINNVNDRNKSKSVKKSSKRKVWKPTGKIGNVTISRVYYVEGLRHNLFFVGQFCDLNLEVAFRQHTSFIRNLEGVDLLTGSRGNNLYTLSLGDMMASSPICLLSKASKTKSWLWHQRLSHLNFGAINHLARYSLV
ncbi:retrovirus-related pol polyprotein from transposon TNT 1-94 [Tanacetum coccineum]